MDPKELYLQSPFTYVNAYDVIVEGKIIASVYPPSFEYLKYLIEEEGIAGCINLTAKHWPSAWIRYSGLEYCHIPITDMEPLTDEQAMEGISTMDRILEKGAVLVHCAAGVGRTGSLISMYLIHHGMSPRDAVALVRERRPGSVETAGQLEGVISFGSGRSR